MPLDPVFSPDFYVRQKVPRGLIYHFSRSLLNWATMYRWTRSVTDSNHATDSDTTILDLTGQPNGDYDWSDTYSKEYTFDSWGWPLGGTPSTGQGALSGSFSYLNVTFGATMEVYAKLRTQIRTVGGFVDVKSERSYLDGGTQSLADYCMIFPCPVDIGGGGVYRVNAGASLSFVDQPTWCDDISPTYVFDVDDEDPVLDIDGTDCQTLWFNALHDNMGDMPYFLGFGLQNLPRTSYAGTVLGTDPYLGGDDFNTITYPLTGTPVAFPLSSPLGPQVFLDDQGGNRMQYSGMSTNITGRTDSDTRDFSVSWPDLQIELSYFCLKRPLTTEELDDYAMDEWDQIEDLIPYNIKDGKVRIFALFQRSRIVTTAASVTLPISVAGTYSLDYVTGMRHDSNAVWGIDQPDTNPSNPIHSRPRDILSGSPIYYFYCKNKDGLAYWTKSGNV